MTEDPLKPAAWLMVYPGCDGSADWVEIGPDEPEPSPPFVPFPLYSRGSLDAASTAAVALLGSLGFAWIGGAWTQHPPPIASPVERSCETCAHVGDTSMLHECRRCYDAHGHLPDWTPIASPAKTDGGV